MDRSFKIVELLLNSRDYITVKDLASYLNVSNKTIRNELIKVEECLKVDGLSLCKKTGVGIKIEGSETKKLYVLQSIKTKAKNIEPYSPEARKNYILKRLFISQGNVTIRELADELYVSRVTIHKDLKYVEKWLERFNLKLRKKTNYGMEIIGDEENWRNAVASLIVSEKDNDELKEILYKDYNGRIDYKTITKLKELINLDYRLLEKIVSKAEESLEFRFSDEAFISLVIHIAISMKRLKDGKDIQLSEDVLTNLRNKAEYHVSSKIASELEKAFNVKLPESEIGYILLHILGAKMQQNHFNNAILVLEDEGDDLAIHMSKEIIGIAERALSIKLSEDRQLLNGLILHLRPTINRLKYGLTLRNPVLQEIKDNYSEIYGVAWMTSVVFERYLGVKIQDEEIGYIALHLGAAVERNKNPLKALVVCASGIGTSQLIAARIEKSFRQIEIREIISAMMIKERCLDDVDIIISTIPIEVSKPVLYISPLLTQNDIKRIESYIETLNSKNRSGYNINSLFDPDLILLGKKYITKENLIYDICQNLLKKGYINADYHEDVLKREFLSSTSVGNGIAIPHGSPDYVYESKIAIVTLDKPIKWDNDEVDVVFMICISNRDTQRAKYIFKNLYKRIDSQDFINALRNIKNPQKVLKFIEERF